MIKEGPMHAGGDSQEDCEKPRGCYGFKKERRLKITLAYTARFEGALNSEISGVPAK